MTGDVASAFRHIGIHSHSVHLFPGRIPELNLLVVDLFCPFGWTGSPSCYEIAGGAISHVHRYTPSPLHPTNFSYHWVDDHICVTNADAEQCAAVETSLRRAMTTILGTTAINEAKFPGWHGRLKVLGLIFDTSALTVPIPPSKIEKARSAVAAAFHADTLTRTSFQSLLGTLRHVATCLRPARAFLQRLRTHERFTHRFSRVKITESMRDDLLWWWQVLDQPVLNRVPMAFFRSLPTADFTIEVDASDVGCCAMDVRRRVFLRYDYNADERALIKASKARSTGSFDINFRELMTCAFAACTWSQHWQSLSQSSPVHIHFRIDNTSAVAWQSRMSSPNPRAQVIIRLLAWLEVQFGIRFSSSHIAGVENIGADAGSRLSGSQVMRERFTNLTRGWTQAPTPASSTILNEAWQRICAITPLQTPPTASTPVPSIGGSAGAR